MSRWRRDSCEIWDQIYILHHRLFICWCVSVPAKDHNNYSGGADWNRCCLPLVWLTLCFLLFCCPGVCPCVSEFVRTHLIFHYWRESQIIWIRMCSLWLLKISNIKTKEVTNCLAEREPRHRKTDRVIRPTCRCRSRLWCHVSRYVCLTVGQHAGRHKQVTAGNIQSEHVPARHHKHDKQGCHFLTLSVYSENLQAAGEVEGQVTGLMWRCLWNKTSGWANEFILYRPWAHVSQEQIQITALFVFWCTDKWGIQCKTKWQNNYGRTTGLMVVMWIIASNTFKMFWAWLELLFG